TRRRWAMRVTARRRPGLRQTRRDRSTPRSPRCPGAEGVRRAPEGGAETAHAAGSAGALRERTHRIAPVGSRARRRVKSAIPRRLARRARRRPCAASSLAALHYYTVRVAAPVGVGSKCYNRLVTTF